MNGLLQLNHDLSVHPICQPVFFNEMVKAATEALEVGSVNCNLSLYLTLSSKNT